MRDDEVLFADRHPRPGQRVKVRLIGCKTYIDAVWDEGVSAAWQPHANCLTRLQDLQGWISVDSVASV